MIQTVEVALLAEAALAADWNRPEEDAAWSHLQPAKSFSSRSTICGSNSLFVV